MCGGESIFRYMDILLQQHPTLSQARSSGGRLLDSENNNAGILGYNITFLNMFII